MRDVRIKKYLKKLDYTYAFGVFPTIELLEKRPQNVNKVLINPKINKELEIKLKDLCAKAHVKYEFSLDHILRIAPKEHTFCIGILEKYKTELEKNTNHVVLVNPSDMGNVGTIIRSMVGFETYNLALIRPAVDVYDPKVIRSSMGSFFHINFEYFDYIEHYLQKHSAQNLYPFVLNGKNQLQNITFKKPFSLIFGNEGEGLEHKVASLGESVLIKHTKNIESLNLASSVSIALFKAQSN